MAKKFLPAVYLVGWEDGIVKAGFTMRTRHRHFISRGAHLILLRSFSVVDEALMFEFELDQLLRLLGPQAFRTAEEAQPYLGGGGRLECFRVDPKTVEEIVRSLLWNDDGRHAHA